MNPDEIIDKVRLIEANFPVTKLIYKGRWIWPLFRSYLVLDLFLNRSSGNKKLFPEKSKASNANVFKSALLSPYKLLKILFLRYRYRNEIKKLVLCSPEVLIYAYPPETYIDEIAGKKYSRYLDPYYEIIKKKYKAINIRPVNTDQPVPADHFHAIFPINVQYFINYRNICNDFFNSQRPSKDIIELIRFAEELNEFLKKHQINFTIDDLLLKKADTAIMLEQFYDEMLKKIKPKAVFMECFYDTYKFALVAACKENGVKSVDIQHGGAEDPMYLPWDKSYRNISYIPDFLWCWSEEDKNIIQRYNGKDAVVLKPVVGGNMWMKKFINSEIKEDENNYNSLLNKSRGYKKVILFSLQWAYDLPENMIRIIESSQNKWFWLIRFHPLTKKEQRDTIIKQLSGYKNVEMDISSSLHLYMVFRLSDVQVTFSSTTVIEALSFCVQTILIHPHGKDYYKDLIRDELAYYAEKTEEIECLIEKTDKAKFPEEKSTPYRIVCSEEHAEKALDLIVN